MVYLKLASYRPTDARWRRWQGCESILLPYDFDELRRVLLLRTVAATDKDRLLAAFIRLDQQNAEGEARTAILACLLPGLRCIVRDYQDILADDAWSEVLAVCWEQAGRYDLRRQPERVAANLLWRTVRGVLRSVRTERAWRDRTWECDGEHVVSPAPTPARSLPLDEAVAAGVIGSFDAALIAATRLGGIRLADTAALLGISYEAAKKRRRRAEVAWVRWWRPVLQPSARNAGSTAA